MSRVVVVDVAELRELVRDVIAEALEGERAHVAPALLDRDGLATALGVSLPTLGRLRHEPGFPELTVGESPRFELAAVLGWLRERGAAAGPADNAPTETPENASDSSCALAGEGSAIQAEARKSAKTHVRRVA